MTTQAFTDVVTIHECGNCGVTFAMTEAFDEEWRKDHKTFYCLNGCRRWYPGETKEKQLKRDLRAAEARASNNHERYQLERRSLIATKGHVTRLKRKVTAGKCPCCDAEFPDLAEHMETEHPDFAGQ